MLLMSHRATGFGASFNRGAKYLLLLAKYVEAKPLKRDIIAKLEHHI